jgi:hypothetical protein
MPVRPRACPGLETAYTNALQQPVREPWAAVAQKIQILRIDDLDGSAAEGTVRFGLDGAEYEIDLNAWHDRELRDALARHVNAARRAGSSARKLARGSRGPVAA